MKVILRFDLPEEQQELSDAMNGWKNKRVIEEVFGKLRELQKYNNKESIKIDDMRKLIIDIQNEYREED